MDNIILLHGALGSKKQLAALQSNLASSFHVHTFDFAGHGGQPVDQGFSIDLFTQNTLEFLRQQQLGQANFFGYSMGGYVALNLAKQHPQLVRKIVTLGTKFNWSPAAAEKEVKLLNPDKIAEKVPAFAAALQATHTPDNWRAVVEETARMMLGLAAGKKLSAEDLQQIQQEVLINIGTLDRMVSIEESEEATEKLPNGQLNIIEGFQHPIEKINAAHLASIIKNFL